jgi:hypothetical protein
MAINYTTLKNEILNDPNAYGYAEHVTAGSNQAIADLLNLPRVAITIRKSDVSSKDIIEAIAISDFPALAQNPTNAQLSTERRSLAWLECLMNVDMVRLLNDDGSDTPVIANLEGMFPVGTGTRNRLRALAVRAGSRAEQLFGTNTFISSSDVAQALAS